MTHLLLWRVQVLKLEALNKEGKVGNIVNFGHEAPKMLFQTELLLWKKKCNN